MSDKAAEEPGTSRTGSLLICDECGKECKSVRGLLQHKQIHSPDYVDTRRPKGSATTLHYKKKVSRKPDEREESEPNKKVTVVVEDASPDDVVTGGLENSEGLKKVTVLVEDCPLAETEKTVCAVDVLFCDEVEEVADCDISDYNISIADCSLMADTEQTECRSELLEGAEGDTTHDKITEEVVENAFTPGEEEIVLVCDESGEYLLPDFEELQSDFMLVSSFQEDEWAEEPVPGYTFENNLNPFNALISNIQNTIPEDWIISPTSKNVRLTLLSHFENVSVQRSIVWTGEIIKMFVHNREVPRDNFVWNSVSQISENDLQDNSVISEYLPKLCCVVQSSRICKGVRLYNDQWARGLEENRGFVESECYVEAACFRDKNCPLLVTDTGMCTPCKKLLNLLKCRSWRASHEKDKDVKKINIKYPTGEAAKERLRETQEEKRKLVKKLFKYRERLRAYIEKYIVPVSTELGTDIAKIFKENEDSMSAVQKLFWSEQLKSLATQKNPCQMRWNPFIIRLALHLQMLSSTAYEYVRLFIHLPSKRTLFDYSHFIDAKEGPQEFIMQDLSRKCKEECLNKHEKYFNLIFDEVDIRSGIVISKRTGDIVGYVKLSDVEEELVQIEAEISEKAEPRKQIAKKLLVYMATGITNSLIGIVGVYTTGGNFTAGQIYTRTWNVIYRLENLGMKVLCLTSDGASVNKKFFKMHFNADPTSKYIYKTKNIACGEDRPLFFITDPVHVLKSLRNNFSNSFSHKKTREMWKDGEIKLFYF